MKGASTAESLHTKTSQFACIDNNTHSSHCGQTIRSCTPNPHMVLPLLLRAWTTSIAVHVFRCERTVCAKKSSVVCFRNDLNICRVSACTRTEILFTPPRRARRRMSFFVMPLMLSRRTIRCRLAPPFPRPIPPLPRPDIVKSM